MLFKCINFKRVQRDHLIPKIPGKGDIMDRAKFLQARASLCLWTFLDKIFISGAHPECFNVTFDEAQKKCASLGKRLCTPNELANDICCGLGCQFDKELQWQVEDGKFF